MRRSGATSACSAPCSAAVIVDQEGEELLAAEERIRGARACTAERRLEPVRAALLRALPPDRQGAVLRAFALYFQLANGAEQHHRLRRRRQYGTRSSARPASRSTTRSSGSGNMPADELRSRLGCRFTRARAHRSPDRGDAPHDPAPGHVRIARAAPRSRRPAADGPGAQRLRGRAGGADHDPLADGRGAARAAARGRRDPPRPLVLRAQPARRGRALLAAYRARLPDARAASFGSWIGGDWTATRAPAQRRSWPRSSAPARSCSGATGDEVRALAVALAMHRSLVDVSPELEESIASDEHELPEYAASGSAPERAGSPTGASCRSCGGGSANEGYALDPRPCSTTSTCWAAASSGTAGARIAGGRLAELRRRVEIFGFHLAKLDLRLHAAS